jgi:hypothetical protein
LTPLIITSRFTNSGRCIATSIATNAPSLCPTRSAGFADDHFRERYRVVGHELVGDRTVDVRGVSVSPALGRVDGELAAMLVSAARCGPRSRRQRRRFRARGAGRGGLSYPQGRAERLRALTLYWGTGFMLGG